MSNLYSRERTTGSISNLSGLQREVLVCNTDTWTDTVLSYGKIGRTKLTLDNVTPHFAKRRARGEIINNPFYTEELEYQAEQGVVDLTSSFCPSGQIQRRSVWTFCPPAFYYNALEPTTSVITESEIDELTKVACTSAMATANSPTTSGLVILGDMRETLHTLRHPLEGFFRFLNGVKSSRKYRAYKKSAQVGKSLLRFMQDEWLTYRYGVRPLLYDIDNTVKAVKDAYVGLHKLRHTARGKAGLVRTDTQTSVDKAYGPGIKATEVLTTKDSVLVRAGMLYDFDSGKVDFEQNWGIRLSDVPDAAWDLLPFSFVADWFVNIQDTIDAYTPRLDVHLVTGWHTVIREQVRTRVMTNSTWNYSGWVASSVPSTTETTTFMSKLRLPGLKTGLTIKPFSLKQFTDSAHIVDLIALLPQMLKRL